MRAKVLCALLALAATASLARGARVQQGLLFEYDFAQSQCASGVFNDTVGDATTSLLGGLLHSSSDALRCPPMGALYRPTAAGHYLSELTASSLLSDTRVPTEVAGAGTGTRPRQYTLEMWIRGSAFLSSRVGRGIDEVTLLALGETSRHQGGIRIERKDNAVRVNGQVVVSGGAYCQGRECSGWDANVTHLVVRVSNEAAGRTARVDTRWRTKSGSGAAASVAAAGFTSAQHTISEKAWGQGAASRLAVAREMAVKEFASLRSTGLVYLTAMYNRALTDAEVRQNFEAWHPEAVALRVPEDGVDHVSGAPWTVPLACTDPIGFVSGTFEAAAGAPLPPPNPLYNASEGAAMRVTAFTTTAGGTLFDSPPSSPAAPGAGAGAAAPSAWAAPGPLSLTNGFACAACAAPSAGFGVRYVPPLHKFGTAVVASLRYRVFKSSGGGAETPVSGCVSDSEDRAIDVFEVNDAPSHREATAAAKITVGVPKAFDLTQIAGGASDVEGDAITGAVVTARNGTHSGFVTVTGTSVLLSYPVSQQALAAFNGAGVVDTIVLDVQLEDGRGARQAAPGTTFTIDVLNYLQGIEAQTSTVSEYATPAPGPVPTTVKDAFTVTLSGRDFALQSRKLRFEVDRAALPVSGKLYQVVRINNGTVTYGEEVAPASGDTWLTVDAVGPADSNGVTRAYLVYLPSAGEFTSPSLTAGTPAGGRELFVPRTALANSSGCGAAAGATCTLRFRVSTDDGARSKPESHALAIVNVPNAPDVAIELPPASSGSPVADASNICVGASGGAAAGRCDVAALQSVPLLAFTKWVDHDHDACEWRAEISAAQGSVYFSDLAALDSVDFMRAASVGDGFREARRLVFFAMPSRMRRVLASLTYFDTAETAASDDDIVTISLSNTACVGKHACASTTMSLAIEARRTATDLEKALGHAKDGKPQYLVIPGTSAALTAVIFVSVVLVVVFSCVGYWRRKVHDLRAKGTCCAVTLGDGSPRRASFRDSSQWSSVRSDSASEAVSADFIVPDSGRSDGGGDGAGSGGVSMQTPPWKDKWEITEHPDYPGSKMYVNTRTQEAQWQAPEGVVFDNGVGVANPLSMGSPMQGRTGRRAGAPHHRATSSQLTASHRTTSSNGSQRADI